ncbi:hypothetical protein B0H19DRAFT_164012 [Mycena capillaripes]|nr:hypothetical protein B0H19DRAFT_164012 [Mycena capillaripes]
MKNTRDIASLMRDCYIKDMTLEETDEWRCEPYKIERQPGRREDTTMEETDEFGRVLQKKERRTRSRSRSPRPPTNSWRHVDRQPLACYNGSFDRWIKDGPPVPPVKCKKLKVKKNHVNEMSQSAPKKPVHYEDTPAIPESTAAVVSRLTREYWDTRRDLANAAARGKFVESQMRTLGFAVDDSFSISEPNLTKQVQELELILETERTKLQAAETILADVLRECETPVVVPELLKLAEMWDDPECAISEAWFVAWLNRN